MRRLEEENNRIFIDAYGLAGELTPEVPITVFLKLRTRIGKTRHFEDHAEQPLLLKRGINTDFDF